MEWFDTLGGWEQGRFLYLLAVLLMIAMFSLPLRRIGVGRLIGYGLAWGVIIGGGWLAASRAPGVAAYIARLGAPDPEVEIAGPKGAEVRVEAALDGHYWVRGRVNGHPVRFLVDTGASDVVLSEATARRVGIDVGALVFDRPGVSASGRVDSASARVDSLSIGPIARGGMEVSIIPGADIDLLGMSFLRTLDGWRVERGSLVLRS